MKGTRCKNDAVKSSKTCAVHKKCRKTTTKGVRKAPAKSKVAAKKVSAKKSSSPVWVKSKAWDSPIPDWMKGGEKIKTKVMTPQNADPWWLQ